MATRRKPAREGAFRRGDGSWFIDHAVIVDADLSWLHDAEELALWNVGVPAGFLARLGRLRGLDLRGGSMTDLAVTDGIERLDYLAVSHVRGLADLGAIASLRSLRFLMLYALASVRTLPAFDDLVALERLQLGQMRSLQSLEPLWRAPALRVLSLSKRVPITLADTERINAHPTLRAFGWDWLDVPQREALPILERVTLPRADDIRPEDWIRRAPP